MRLSDFDIEITPHTRLKDILASYPQCADLFARFGIDACCGVDVTIEMAAEKHGFQSTQVLISVISEFIQESHSKP